MGITTASASCAARASPTCTGSCWAAATASSQWPIQPTRETIYNESQGGAITRVDRLTSERKAIKPQGSRGEPPLRWNWNTPLMISPHASSTIFAAANRVLKSTDRGDSWRAISPDLTRSLDRETFSLMGVPAPEFRLAKHDGVGAFGTLVAFAESPKRAGLFYTGANDGAVHVSGVTERHIEPPPPSTVRPVQITRIPKP